MGEAWQDEWKGEDWEAAWASGSRNWVVQNRFEDARMAGGGISRVCWWGGTTQFWRLAESTGGPILWIPALTGPCSMGCGRGAGCGATRVIHALADAGRRLDRR